MSAEQLNVKSGKFSLLVSALIIVGITVTLRSTNNMMITTMPIFSKDIFNFSNVSVGELTALTYATTFLTTLLLNPRLESVQRRRIFIVSIAVIDVSLVLLYFSDSISIWPIAALSGVAFGMVFPNLVTSASLHGDHRAQMRLLAIYSVSLSLSLVIGPVIETFILPLVGYRGVFLAFLPMGIIGTAVAPLVRFPRGSVERRGRKTLGNSSLRASLLSISVYNVPFAAITSFLVIYGEQNYHVSSSIAYSAFIIFFASSFTTRLLLAVRPMEGLRTPLVVSSAITVASLVSIPFIPTFYAFLVVMVFMGIPHGSIFPLTTMMIARGTEPEERNAANSYFMAYNNILFMIIPVAFGYLSSQIGFHDDFVILGTISAAFIIALMIIYGKERKIFYRN